MKEKTITQLGSNWNNWSNAGTFYWNLNNSVSNRNRNIRGHLIFAKKNTAGYHVRLFSCVCSFNLATWQNRKIGGARQPQKGNTALLIKTKEMSTVSTG